MFFHTHEVNLAYVMFLSTLTRGQCFIDSAKQWKKHFVPIVLLLKTDEKFNIFFLLYVLFDYLIAFQSYF